MFVPYFGLYMYSHTPEAENPRFLRQVETRRFEFAELPAHDENAS